MKQQEQILPILLVHTIIITATSLMTLKITNSLQFQNEASDVMTFLVPIVLFIILMSAIVTHLWLHFRIVKKQTNINTLIHKINTMNQRMNFQRSVSISNIDDISELITLIDAMSDAIEQKNQETQNKVQVLDMTLDNICEQSRYLLQVVDVASQGDLSTQIQSVTGNESMIQLGTGISAMLNGLNDLIRLIKQASIQVHTSATDIETTAKQQEDTAKEQSISVNETISVVNVISATSKTLLETMNSVAVITRNMATTASQGKTALLTMEDAMHHMVGATESIDNKLTVISEKTSNINLIVTTITRIADQTNLLSLNAAIEAEKAGKYGIGFSVVAVEIRRLAEQTAVAIWDIEKMVKDMLMAVSEGVSEINHFAEEIQSGVENVSQVVLLLSNIIENVQNLIPQFDMLHNGMQSQSQAAEQISDSMTHLNKNAQQTTIALQQINEIIVDMNDAARILQNTVSKFKLAEDEIEWY